MALTATAVSVLPVIHASRARPWHVLKQTGGAATPRGARGFGSRAALVAGEIAVALVLLAGAGLMLRSALLLQRTPLGADPTNVLTAELELPGARYTPERGRELQHTLLEGIRAIPGVDAAGWTFCVPVSGRCNGTLAWFPPQPQRGPGQDPLVGIGWATPGYFEAFRIPVLEGRHFTEQDREGQPRVVLVNETAARTFWPGESAIGKRLGLGQGGFHEGAEVIGVVADVRYRSLEGAAGAEPGPFVYLPPAQSYRGRLHLVVRSRVEPRGLIAALGREVRDLDAALPLVGINIKMMDERLADAMWRTRVTAWLLSALAGLAMLLTAMGVFGVMAQTVAQRTPEFGVRMALGAERRDVLGLVLRRAVVVTAVGVGLGLAAALALTRVLSALLHGVTPTDPATLGGVAAVLSLVSLAAAWLPARRAARIDPLRSLREE
jgi:predicted permease